MASTCDSFDTSTVTGIYDKGSGALVVTENVAVDAATGEPLATTRSSAFIRGEGGFGGERGSDAAWDRPDREPDHQAAHRIQLRRACQQQIFQCGSLKHTVVRTVNEEVER